MYNCKCVCIYTIINISDICCSDVDDMLRSVEDVFNLDNHETSENIDKLYDCELDYSVANAKRKKITNICMYLYSLNPQTNTVRFYPLRKSIYVIIY